MNLSTLRAAARTAGPGLLVEVLVNFVLPWLIYDQTQKALGEVSALLASSAPPILWSAVEFLRARRIDAVSLMVLAGIALSLLAVVGGGSVKFLQLREKLASGLMGLVFVGSVLVDRPLIWLLARASQRRRSAAEAEAFEAAAEDHRFRRAMKVLTLVWGLGFVAEAGLGAVLVFRLPIRTYLIVGGVMGYAVMGALALWTFWYVRRLGRRRAPPSPPHLDVSPPAP